MTSLIALPNNTELASDYRIERVLGAGGFGITYLADEMALGRRVTIKEYFPSDFAARSQALEAVPRSQSCDGDYKWGLDRFIEEAQTLAKFNHPNIVRVYRYFRANNTGYMVLHFEEGQSLKSWLKGLGRAPRQKELDNMVAPLLDALDLIHKADFLHRDIAPDNIIIRKDGGPVLIDFGSARGEIASHSKTVSALVKPGYSPYEQYAETSRDQGPWTDIYALAATLYHAVTGKRPPDAPSRMVKDEIVPAREAALAGYRTGFLKAIDRGLALGIRERPQSIPVWRGELLAPDPAKPGWLARTRTERAPGPREAAEAEPAAKAAVQTAIPPPPDAPGPKGGMLDFLDGIKKKPGPVAQPPSLAGNIEAAPAPTARIDEQPAPPKFLRKANLPVPVPAKPAAEKKSERKARPRPVRSERRGRLRPVLFKLLVGAGVASAAVALQNRLPYVESRGEATTTLTTSSIGGRPEAAPQTPQLAPLVSLRGHAGPVNRVLYTEDGQTLVTAGSDGTLKVWRAGDGILLRTIELDDGPATALAVSGRQVITGHTNGAAVLWDLDSTAKNAVMKRNEAEIWGVAFTGAAARIATASHDSKIALWDGAAPAVPLQVIAAHQSTAEALAFSAAYKSPRLVSGGADKQVALWDLDTMERVRRYRGHRDTVTAVAFSPDGRLIASGGSEGSVRVWSALSNTLKRRLYGHKARVGGLAFSPDGDILATAGDDGQLRLWDFDRGRTSRTLIGAAGKVTSVAFSPDGAAIAAAGEDGLVRIWPNPLKRVATN